MSITKTFRYKGETFNTDTSYLFESVKRKRFKGQPRWATKPKKLKGRLMAVRAQIEAEFKKNALAGTSDS